MQGYKHANKSLCEKEKKLRKACIWVHPLIFYKNALIQFILHFYPYCRGPLFIVYAMNGKNIGV